ncbi:MAG: hypothetical protein HKN92_06875 [Chitinophagales bacterium]|nr:hypothetical protein [Chitinophagales bacterium]
MRYIIFFARIVVITSLLNFSAYAVYHVMSGGERFGSYSKHILSFATFPGKIYVASTQIVFGFHPYKVEKDEQFHEVNELDQDLFTLVSHYNSDQQSIVFQLINFKNEEVMHEWVYQIDDPTMSDQATCTHPILLDDYSLIFGLHIGDLLRIDRASNVLWRNDQFAFHHSKELDDENYLWVPVAHRDAWLSNMSIKNMGGKNLMFRDDRIAKVDIQSGKVIFDKSVTKILLENDHESLLCQFYEQDLVHLNDIQPVFEDGKYWKRGDLFISCRNIHTVFQYRPSTDKVVWLKTGPWINQHDIDIIDSNRIMVFNNNFIRRTEAAGVRGIAAEVNEIQTKERFNQITTYNFKTNNAKNIFENITFQEKISTTLQGRSQLLKDGRIFIEETNNGKFFVADSNKIIFRKQFAPVDPSIAMMPGWARIYEDLPEKE